MAKQILILAAVLVYHLQSEGLINTGKKALIADTIYWYKVTNSCLDQNKAILDLEKPLLITYTSELAPLCTGTTYCCALGYILSDIDTVCNQPKIKTQPTFVRYHD